MSKEQNYFELYRKYKKYNPEQLEDLVQDLYAQLDIAERPTSEAFKILNESSNNLKLIVLLDILEEKGD
jgi:hypothetical protein